MKRYLLKSMALLLTLTLICPFLGIQSAIAVEDPTVLLSEDFSTEVTTPGNTIEGYNGWSKFITQYSITGTRKEDDTKYTVATVPEEDPVNYAASLKRLVVADNTGLNPYMSKALKTPVNSGVLSIRFRVMANHTSITNSIFLFRYYRVKESETLFAEKYKNLQEVQFRLNDGVINGLTTIKYAGGEPQTETWYDLEAVADYAQKKIFFYEHTAEGKCKLLGNVALSANMQDTATYSVTHLAFGTFRLITTDADIYFDDIMVRNTTVSNAKAQVDALHNTAFTGSALPTSLNGATIAWESNNTDVIANDGTVTPIKADATVNLTATISKDGITADTQISVTIPGYQYEAKVEGVETSGGKITGVRIQKNANPGDSKVIIAAYTGDILERIALYDLTDTTGSETVATDFTVAEGQSYKVFEWNLVQMLPLSLKYPN